MNHMTVIFRKKAVQHVGGYPSLFLKEDYGLWVLLLKNNYKFCNSQQILVNANAGIDMYRRRGGLKYVKSEFQLQKFLYIMGMKNMFETISLFLFRSFIFLLPSNIRGIFYRKFLRVKLIN